jgi:hypothetical protein
MAEAGHPAPLKNNIEDPRNTVLIVGWQAPNTLGRRLVEQAPVVRIFGMEYHREAEVVTLNGFSNHADQPGLLGWAQAFKKPPERTFVVHGDPEAAQELATRLRHDLGSRKSDPACRRLKLKIFGFIHISNAPPIYSRCQIHRWHILIAGHSELCLKAGAFIRRQPVNSTGENRNFDHAAAAPQFLSMCT